VLLSAALFSAIAAQETRSDALPSELPLHTAIAAGNLDEVRRLLDAGADPNARISMFGVDLRTPLSVAFYDWPGAEAGSAEVVRLLLQTGADPNGTYNIFLAQFMAGMEQCMTGAASFNCAALLELLRRN
jgi:ankyrin repeat protein